MRMASNGTMYPPYAIMIERYSNSRTNLLIQNEGQILLKGGKKRWHDAANLSNRARTIGPAIMKIARDPENWGMAKSFAMAAHDAGYDLSNENDMGKAMMAYNTKALANYLTGTRHGPAALGTPVRTKKVGRN
jgi:hypothetical protein